MGESFTLLSLAGTVLVAGGAVLIATFGALAEASHTLDQLLVLLGRHQFLLWMLATTFIVIGALLGIWFLERLPSHNTARVRLLRGMSYGFVSGILSAHSLLVAKSAVELLVRTIVDRHNQFDRWQSWVILLGLVALALSQLYCLHRGLKLCSTSVLYPFVFCVYNIIAILDGLIYFRQTSRLPVLHALLIALGTVILLSGVLALSWRLDEDHHPTNPVSPKVHTRHLTPQTPLTPGMGLVTSDSGSGSDQPSDYDSDSSHHATLLRRRTLDEESGPSLHTTTHPTEQTPLLSRPTTTETASTTPRRTSTRRPLRLRRLTAPEEAASIWTELHDDDDGAYSRRPSPLSLRQNPRGLGLDLDDPKPASGDARRVSSVSFTPQARRQRLPRLRTAPEWSGGRAQRGKRPAGNSAEDAVDADEGAGEGEGEGEAGEGAALLRARSRRRRASARSGEGGEAGWVALQRWWKRRRRRDGEAEGEAEGNGGGGRRAGPESS